MALLLREPGLDLRVPDLGFGERLVGVFVFFFLCAGRLVGGEGVVGPVAGSELGWLFVVGRADGGGAILGRRRGCVGVEVLRADERVAGGVAVGGPRTTIVGSCGLAAPSLFCDCLIALLIRLEHRVWVHHIASGGALPRIRLLLGLALRTRRHALAAVVVVRTGSHPCSREVSESSQEGCEVGMLMPMSDARVRMPA